MKYFIGQDVTYVHLNGRKEIAKILTRKDLFENDQINTEFAKGNFDYLIVIKRNGIPEDVFCNETDLE